MTRMFTSVYAVAAAPILLAPLSGASHSLRGDPVQDAKGMGTWTAADLSRNNRFDGEIPAGFAPSVKAVEGEDYIYEGCYNYGPSQPHWYSIATSTQMTIEMCYAYCESTGGEYMGLMFGNYCLCGDQESLSSYTSGGQASCGTVCNGDSSKTCGGSWVMDLYSLHEPTDTPTTPTGGTLTSTPAEMTRLLELHNGARCMHNADPLTYSSTIESTAEAYALTLTSDENCGKLFHSDGTGYGENLYFCWSTFAPGCFTPERAMESLYDEEVPSRTAPVTDYLLHATQILWKSTTAVGCGVATCTKDSRFYEVLVCNYNPPGNFFGQFEQQLEKPSKTEAECGYP